MTFDTENHAHAKKFTPTLVLFSNNPEQLDILIAVLQIRKQPWEGQEVA